MTTSSFNNNLEFCIKALSLLPIEDFLPITLESDGEKAVWTSMRNHFQGKAAWLRVLMLMEPMPPALLETSMRFLKPQAEISKALASLVTEVYLRAGDLPIVMEFNSPVGLWLACEVSSCRIRLDASGLTGSPALIGKRDSLNLVSRTLDQLEKLADGMSIDPQPEILLSSRFSLTQELKDIALELAKECPQFNQSHYRPYLKAERYWVRKIQRCRDLQLCYYHPGSDQLIVTGKGKKLPPRT